MLLRTCTSTVLAILLLGAPAAAQGPPDFPTDDPVLRAMWQEGMEDRSQIESLAQVLLDSIGPRLTGTPQKRAANEWIRATYDAWGIPNRAERFGTWRGWERGHSHIDLVAPRVRTLSGMLLAWSPGTEGPVEADVVAMPPFASAQELGAWLPRAAGRFVAISFAEPTCRAPESWSALATPESWQAMQVRRAALAAAWRRAQAVAGGAAALAEALADAGAVGIVTARWSEGWGADKIFDAETPRIPTLHLSCEDYGLVHRLAARSQGPRLRLDAEARFTGEVPSFNVIGELRGTELPDEYVVLSAHLDSWDGASGATDNGSGTVMMMEAMRILKAAYPNPRRTILVGHWAAEEQGLIGSRAFVEDHPEIVDNLQVALNQDNGTWRVEHIRMQGFVGAAESFGRWLSAVPDRITRHITLDIPGVPETGGSDHVAFMCGGAPGFRLQSHYPDYRQYTWHTGIDTFDKLVIDDLKNNATLAAMLAYLASEDPERVDTTKRRMPAGQGWTECRPARRAYPG